MLVPVEHREHPLRIGIADHRRRAQGGPVLERDALAGRYLGDLDAAGENRSRLRRGVGDREAAHPHPALDVAPDRALAVEVALVVHELDRGGAVVVGPAPGPDDPLTEQRGLQPLVGDVLLQHVGDRCLEDEVDHRL